MTPDPRRWRALGVLLLGQFAALLDVSVTNVALPSIGRSTGSSPSELQWIVTGYVLAFGLMPIIGGRLGDIGGRRRIFIIGLVGFVAASAAVGLSPDPVFIIVARVVQGLFGGVLGPQVSGYIQNAFPREERGRAFGRLGLALAVATALGPVVGGLLIALGGPEFGWRLVFFINLPIGITAIVLAFRPLRRNTGTWMFACVFLYGLATIGFGLSKSFVLSMAMLMIVGATDMVSVAVRQTLVQLETPEAMRGRVSAVNLVFVGASNELGEFESGVTAAWLNPVRAVVVGGVGTLLVVLVWAGLFPELRKVDRLG